MSSSATARLPQAGPGDCPALVDAAGWQAAPFDAALAGDVRALVARLSPAQRAWLSGYLAGSLGTAVSAAPAAPAAAGHAVTILYGTQSGNCDGLAKRLAARLAAAGHAARVLDMLDCRKADLEQAARLLVIVSTHGDGDPPERAAPLFELLAGRKAPRLPHVQYAVLALGDRSYEHFCAAGRTIDARLEQLGAQRLRPCEECDVDFDAPAAAWMDWACTQLASPGAPAPVATPAPQASANVVQAWTRRHPFHAPVLANLDLTVRGSTRQVRHVELSLEGSNIQYEPGDALGIVPRNADVAVEALLAALRFVGAAAVQVGEHETDLYTALAQHCEIGTLTAAFVKRYAEAGNHAALAGIAGDKEKLTRYLWGRDVLDMVTEYPPAGLDAASFARLLSPLAPRLYSISSSQAAHPDEVHLTVGVVAYEARQRARLGTVSGAIAAMGEDTSLPVYLHRNEGFRLPADPATPIVMIGAGTGVAPYRGFLAEREARAATGRNWLVFGNRSFEHDFLYQSEWLAWRRSGLLTRIDVAFSRDQPEKVYVQHRLREHGAELWRWLRDGAHLYVCGDAARMAPDVERALLDIAMTHGGLDEEAAREHLRQLQRERRYQKDVY